MHVARNVIDFSQRQACYFDAECQSRFTFSQCKFFFAAIDEQCETFHRIVDRATQAFGSDPSLAQVVLCTTSQEFPTNLTIGASKNHNGARW